MQTSLFILATSGTANFLTHRFIMRAHNHKAWSHTKLLVLLALLAMFSPARGLAQMIDLNTNRMSDVWEYLYAATGLNPTDDTDGDGAVNMVEAVAGTDPRDPNSVPKITLASYSGTNFTVSIPCALGKQYQLQSTTNLGSGVWVTETSVVARSGTVVSLSAPASSITKLFRIGISDVDTDGDGVNDWEEYQLGLDPTKPFSNGQIDGNGQPMNDYAYAVGKFASQDVFTITASDPIATQPDAGQAALNNGQFTITRGGFPLRSVTINLTNLTSGLGIATESTDYAPLPRTVYFPAGVSSQYISVVPMANSNLLAPVVINLRLIAGPGYRIGIASNATVVLYPSTTPLGGGLTGQYYTNSSSTYASPANFNGSNLKLTQTDAGINFTWNTTNNVPITNSGYMTVRWTGQVMPQYSETYYFVANTDDGVKLWVNDQLIIDHWVLQGASDSVGSIALQGGTRYDIRMDYFNGGGPGSALLSWYSASQPKIPIPASRLYPASAPTAQTAITSPINAYAFLNQPFTFTLTGANTATSFTATGLPPGLSLNAATGVVSGTPTLAGDFEVSVTASNVLGVSASLLDIQVIDTGSAVVREVWLNVPGTNISDIPVSTPATLTNTLGTLEGITNFGDNYAERVRGFITAPTTGNYYFWIAGSDSAELWISNNGEPVNKVRRAYVSPAPNVTGASTDGTGPRQWSLQTKQQSGWLSLIGGQQYYVEILHKAGVGLNDNFSVGWLLDSSGTNTVPSGVVPGYVLSKYYPTPPAYVPGTLYSANMLAEAGAVSDGVGTATLRVSADGTQAILKFAYSGLSSTVTAKHIHSDNYLNVPSEIIFDLDTATPQPDGSYVWPIAPTTDLSTSDILEIIREGKAYINIHTLNYPLGEINGHFSLAVGAQSFVAPPPPPAWTEDSADPNAASRFLMQASFGPSLTEIGNVQSYGYSGWISNQMAMPISRHLTNVLANPNSDPNNPWASMVTFNTWWMQSVTAPDQLRQRVAFALSEILVVSEAGILQDNARALSSYYDVLLTNAFGNFRDLLESVTLSPAMGLYLDMRGNAMGNLAAGTHANENYGREILQLFSVGLNRLWPDGSLVMDSGGNLVPTYDQSVILGFAADFTGWNYHQANQANGHLPTQFFPAADYINPMVLVPTYHDLNSKRLLDNVIVPPGNGIQTNNTTTNFDGYCSQNLEAAMDSIFYNQNVGPFICRELIQRLVTSNPSRGYLYRVVQAFNDNGQGVRGDLKAVVRAILLDYEARSVAARSDATFGKQREPLLRATAAARAFPPPAPYTATYSQSGDRIITIVTPAAHRQNSGDTVVMNFTDGSGGQPTPGPGGYNISAAGTNILTINAPGISSGTFTQVLNTTISNMVTLSTVTTNVIFLNIGSHGLIPSNSVYLDFISGGTYVQTNNTTISNMVTLSMSSNTPAITVTINNHGFQPGNNVFLDFTSGGAASGTYQVVNIASNNNVFTVLSTITNNRSGNVFLTPPAVSNGVYQVISTTNSSTFAVATPATAPFTGTVMMPKLSGPGFVQSGTTITVTMTNHGLVNGNQVLIDFPSGTAANGVYTVSAVVDASHFSVTSGVSANQTQGTTTIYPLVAPPLMRSGTVQVSQDTWNFSYSDSDLTQTPIRSPTVFNFFFPDYMFPGTLASAGLTTPEFQLTSDTTVAYQMNFFQSAVLNSTGNTNGLTSFRNSGLIVMDLGPWMTQSMTADSGIPGLVDSLSSLLIGGQLSPSARLDIISYVANTTNFPLSTPVTYTQMRERVRAVVHLLLLSPDFMVQD
jgi:uncharacterized protein (DUF1800 family)